MKRGHDRTYHIRFRANHREVARIGLAAALDGLTVSELSRRATLREVDRMLETPTPAGGEPDGRGDDAAGRDPRFPPNQH